MSAKYLAELVSYEVIKVQASEWDSGLCLCVRVGHGPMLGFQFIVLRFLSKTIHDFLSAPYWPCSSCSLTGNRSGDVVSHNIKSLLISFCLWIMDSSTQDTYQTLDCGIWPALSRLYQCKSPFPLLWCGPPGGVCTTRKVCAKVSEGCVMPDRYGWDAHTFLVK